MMLSYGSAFMNSIAAAAWLPWCAAAFLDLARAAHDRARIRSAVAAGLGLGLQLLAGEPAISLLTLAFSGALVLASALAAPRAERARRLAGAAVACLGAGALSPALAPPLLLPLRAVFSLTYRGQHLYSERASGRPSPPRARRVAAARLGQPGCSARRELAARSPRRTSSTSGAHVRSGAAAPRRLAALRRPFWDRRSGACGRGARQPRAGVRVLTAVLSPRLRRRVSLRKLRYPIKFYLLTTLCVALLAGLAPRPSDGAAPESARRS
jgi:hypothetical protein